MVIACCPAWAQTNPCDLNLDGAVNIADVEAAVQMMQGILPCTADIVGNNECNLIVVERVQIATYYSLCFTGYPASPALYGLSLSPAVVTGGQSSTGTFYLSGPAGSGGALVALSSSNSAVVVPPSVQIPEGSTSATFSIVTTGGTGVVPAIVTGVYGGVWAIASLTVNSSLAGLSVSPGSLVSGQAATGTVTLAGPAGAGGALVSLSSSSSVVGIPATVTVPQGSNSATFTVTAGAATAVTTVQLTASFSGASSMVTITVAPPSVMLTWVPSTSPNVAGYNVYRGTVSGGPYTGINSSLVGSTSYTDATVQTGLTYFYVTTSVDTSNNESVYSNEAQVTIP